MEGNQSYEEWINSRKENFPYYSPAPNPGEFPILASTIVYDSDTGTEYSPEEFRRPKEAGFNVMGVGGMGNLQFPLNLQTAEDVGVKLDAFNYAMCEIKLNGLEFFGKDGSFKGNLGCTSLFDEPTFKQLIDTTAIWYDKEGNRVKNLHERYQFIMEQPEVWFTVLINLLGEPYPEVLEGNPQEKQTLEFSSANQPLKQEREMSDWEKYENYVETYQEYFKPPVFCYDFYPIFEYANLLFAGFGTGPSNKQEGTVDVACDTFYKDLEIFARISKKYNRPFWTFMQSMCMMHSNKNGLFKPVQLEQYLRFQVFNALAYGAKGILYFTYGMRKNQGNEKYFSALLNRRNEETASWHFAKKVNEEVHQYEDIFVRSSVDTTYKCKGVEIAASRIANMVVIGESEIVSSLIYKGKDTYLMIVNTDALNYQSVKIDVGLGRIIELTPLTSEGERNVQLEIGKTERILPPGGYRIFRLTNLIITGNPMEEGQYIYPIFK